MAEYHLDTSLARETWATLDAFTQGYVEAAMWTLTGDDGEPMDHLGLHDIVAETIEAAKADCADFLASYRALLDETGETDDRRHGVDFWLTRNRHGAGFWDRGYDHIGTGLKSVGDALTDAAHAYGEADWYVGDDGSVYQM